MFGLETMLKGMGLDPAEIKSSITNMGKMVEGFRDQLNRIEDNQKQILGFLANIGDKPNG